jgi:hypothetical protein
VTSAAFGPPGWVVGGLLIAALTVGGILVADAAIDAAHTSSQPALQASGGVAYPNPPPPDDPFRDMSKEAQDRIKSHRGILENPRVNPAYKQGLRAQLQRAEELARQGQLEDYEASFGRNRFDLTLKGGDRVIEVKYWTKSYAEKHFDSLVDQLLKQQATGKEVILNMYQTKGNSITWEYWTQLLNDLEAQGVTLSDESALLCLVE